jgi:DNA-binding IclR family transcriptional regulator
VIQSVERAIDILNAVATKGDWTGVREIARLTGLKVPTAQQLLKTLQAKAFLQFDVKRRQYRIGIGVLLLARNVDPLRKLRDFLHPYVEAFFAEHGETVLVLTMEQGSFLVLAAKPSSHQLTVKPPAAGEVPERPYIMATGRMLLAHQPEDVRRRYVKSESLLRELKSIRRAGLCLTCNIERSGVAALAVPIHRPHGSPIMAFGCSVPTSRFSDRLRERLVKSLRETAARIERSMR